MARPPMGPPGLPPGMTMRKRGGRVADGPAYDEGVKHRPVDHAPGKMDGADIGRKKVITYSKGGSVGGRRLVKFWAGGPVERKRGGRVGDGLGTHHTATVHHAKASGGLESPITRGVGGNEVPHHPKKRGPIGSENGPMGPNFHAGGGGGKARLRKIARETATSMRLP